LREIKGKKIQEEEIKMGKNGWRDGQINVKKLTVSAKMPVQYIIPKTVAYATGALLAGKDFNAASTALSDVNLLIQPPYAKNLIVTAGVAGTAGHNDYLKIGGYKADGSYVFENVIIKGTAAGTTSSYNAFAAVNYVKPYGQTSANTTVKSTKVGIGFGDTVGLPYPIASNDDIITYAYDGGYATTQFKELTISSTYNTLTTPAHAANKVISVLYKSKVQK
jgi:hypothetical protein